MYMAKTNFIGRNRKWLVIKAIEKWPIFFRKHFSSLKKRPGICHHLVPDILGGRVGVA
jgi:hypothetical protein